MKTHTELCDFYDVNPLPGESIGVALCREFENELKKCICVPTNKLPKRFRGKGHTTTLAAIERRL